MARVDTALVVKSLFGDLVDADAVAKMGPDSSIVHVNGLVAVRRRRPVAKRAAMTPEERRKRAELERKVAQVSNVVGLGAGTAGTVTAVQGLRRHRMGDTGPVTGLVARKLKVKGSTAARLGVAGAASATALQGANVLGDVVTARVLGSSKVDKGIPMPKLLAGRIASFKSTMGLSVGRHTPRGQRMAAGVPGGVSSTAPQPVVPGPTGAVSARAFGPMSGGQRAAAATAAGHRQKAEEFLGSGAGKATVGGVAAAALYGRGKKNGAQEAYYGKAHVVDVGIEGSFSKFDDDKRRAYGWASVVTLDGEPVIDRQGDYIGLDDIEEAAYTYVRKSRVTGDMHRRGLDDTPHRAGELIESVVFTPDKCHAMGLPASFAGKWWMGVQVEDDEVWAEVKKGNRTGFSIHGKGLRKDTTLDEIKAGH